MGPLFSKPWSITSLIKREEKEWVANNSLRKNLKYGWFESGMLFTYEHPTRFVLSLFMLAILLYLNLLFGLPWVQQFGELIYWPHKGDEAQSLNAFNAIWAIQAAIVGFVYPLVIGFVSLQLQKKPNSNALLRIYLIDSGALTTGLSSISLVIMMTVVYLIFSSQPDMLVSVRPTTSS